MSFAFKAPFAASLIILSSQGEIELIIVYSQPGVHQMWASNALVVEKGVHRDFPEARELRLSLTCTGDAQTVVRHTIVQSIGPVRVGVWIGDRDGGGSAGIISKLGVVEELQGVL